MVRRKPRPPSEAVGRPLTEEELRRGGIPPGWSRQGWLERCRYMASIVIVPEPGKLFAEAAAAIQGSRGGI